ncbi:unnamed protein product [Moneuplotes crassus]|uniref:EF-hand domain-containing protein n=1 Tax=Euplotes crassus TaxID=5936 RepID=A0AAD1U858_EUPCR|nr:unnamed protein product [Moneuplotes crassus]
MQSSSDQVPSMPGIPCKLPESKFDLLQHYAPAYNRHGYQIMNSKHKTKNTSVLFEGIKGLGRNHDTNFTFSDIQAKRKLGNLPHPSFDLNGDGTVSMHELAIGKRFDEDKDGVLNDQERKNCLEALRNGFENGLSWNRDKSQLRNNLKKGTFVGPKGLKGFKRDSSKRNNSFQPQADSESSQQVSKVEKKDLAPNTTKLATKRFVSPMIKNNHIHSRRYSQNEVETNLNFDPKKLMYNNSCTTKTEGENTKELKKFSPKPNVLSALERLNNRENAFYRQREFSPASRTTYESMKQDRKNQTMKELERLTADVRPGIQKINVPFKNLIKRSKNIVEKESQKDSENSHKRLWHNRNYYKEEMDPSTEQLEFELPKDIFKDYRSINKVMNNVTPKVTQKMYNYGSKYSLDKRNNVVIGGRRANPSRFASKQLSFKTKNGERLYNQYPEIPPSEKDFDPVPSSFITSTEMSKKLTSSSLYYINPKFGVNQPSPGKDQNKSVRFKDESEISYNRFNSLKENLRYTKNSKARQNSSMPISPARSPRGTMNQSTNSDTKVSFANATSYGIRSSGFS